MISLQQNCFSPDRRGELTEQDALAALDCLRRADPDPSELRDWGDSIILAPSYASESKRQVQSLFGENFAAAVFELEAGSWQGPVFSGSRLHLVRVAHRIDSRIPDWTATRQQVLKDMPDEAHYAAEDQWSQEITQRYQLALDEDTGRLLGIGGESRRAGCHCCVSPYRVGGHRRC